MTTISDADQYTKARRLARQGRDEPHHTFADAPLLPQEAAQAAQLTGNTITFGDRFQAFLNHLFSMEGLTTIVVILGIVLDSLSGQGINAPWAASLITALTIAYTVGSKIVAMNGHGQLATVLKVKGKLPVESR